MAFKRRRKVAVAQTAVSALERICSKRKNARRKKESRRKKMPTVPVDGRKQYEKWIVEVANAMSGRPPTAGVQEQVIGDRYILDKYPPP